MSKVNFSVGTLAKYQAATKDVNTLYFITDAKRIYKGEIDVTENIVVVTNFDGAEGGVSLATAFEGKFYINITSFEVRIVSGNAWVVLLPGYVTDSVNWADTASENKFATIKVIKAAIADAIATITDGNAFVTGLSWTKETGSGDGKLVVTNGDTTTDISLSGLPYKLAYDAANLTLTISAYGEDDVVINLPKDNFVKSGSYDANTKEIVLVVDDGDETTPASEVRIPAASLVDVYTGADTDTVKVTVSDGNEISASVVISAAEGNMLEVTEDGLFVAAVDISGKVNKHTVALDRILVSDGNGGLKDGGQTVAELTASITAIITQVQGDVKTLQDNFASLTTALNNKLAKIANGTENNIVSVATNGEVKDSGKKIGGATLAETPDEYTVATEIAVDAAITDAVGSALAWGTIS